MRFVNYKFIIGGVFLIILLLFLVNTTTDLLRIQRTGSVVDGLENELREKENHNKFLIEQLKYVQTNEFIERESREKLGLVKQDEVVVQERIGNSVNTKLEEKLSKPNWKLWIELFI